MIGLKLCGAQRWLAGSYVEFRYGWLKAENVRLEFMAGYWLQVFVTKWGLLGVLLVNAGMSGKKLVWYRHFYRKPNTSACHRIFRHQGQCRTADHGLVRVRHCPPLHITKAAVQHSALLLAACTAPMRVQQ